MSVVLDASAILALIFEERGADVALSAARGSFLSAVNLDEVLHKTTRRAIAAVEVETELNRLEIEVRPFDAAQARRAAILHPAAHRLNISFADRACLALAMESNRAVVTAEGKWLELRLPLDIRLIR